MSPSLQDSTQKLAESATGIFVSESMAYRTIGMIDAALASLEGDNATNAREIQKKIEEAIASGSGGNLDESESGRGSLDRVQVAGDEEQSRWDRRPD